MPISSIEAADHTYRPLETAVSAFSSLWACSARRATLLHGDKTPPNWPWWWVTFGELSRFISPECRSECTADQNRPRMDLHLSRRFPDDGRIGLPLWGSLFMDLLNPAKIIGVGDSWILQPEDPWEITGYVHNVVFTCGAVVEPDGTVKI
jgi:hypothetical protein